MKRVLEEKLDAPPEDTHTIAAKYDCDPEEVTMLTWQTIGQWRKLRDSVNVVALEWKCGLDIADGWRLEGSPDVLGTVIIPATDDNLPQQVRGVIIDWKTGWHENNHYQQLLGYALLASRERAMQTWSLFTVWPRLGLIEHHVVHNDDLQAFSKTLHDMVTKGDLAERCDPDPEVCLYCRRRHECQARLAMLEQAGHDMAILTGGGAPAKSLASLYPASRMISKALDDYDKALKEAVKAAGGSLDIDDESVVRLDGRTRKTIAWNEDVIEHYVEAGAVTPTVSKTQLEKAIKDNSPKGKGARNIRDCMELLQAEGCISETPYDVLVKAKKGS